MLRPRSTAAMLLVSIIVSVLLCGIVAAELPELLTLTDNTSNDFTIHKSGLAERAPKLSVANHLPIRLHGQDSESGARVCWADAFGDAGPPSAELFVLNSVLRR